jgi:hypothetical protein
VCFGKGCLERVLQRSWPPMHQLCHAYWDLIERRTRPRDNNNFFTVCVTGGFVSEKELWRISPRDFATNPSSLIECEEVRIIRYVLRFSLCRFKSWLDSDFFLSFLFPLPLEKKDSWASACKKEKISVVCFWDDVKGGAWRMLFFPPESIRGWILVFVGNTDGAWEGNLQEGGTC